MPRLTPRTVLLATLLALPFAAEAAETLRCQSVNGNLNCAGSGGVSCQTINGQRTCVSGGGGVVQSFGSDTAAQPDDMMADDDPDDMPPPRPGRHRR